MADSTETSLPISVIIPAYNRSHYVGEAVRSALQQTRPALEVIVVDDGSSDNTADVARAAGAAVMRQENRGLSAARNAGIRAAKGDWLAFFDDDDLWLPTKLERQWELVERCPDVGFVFTDHSAFSDQGVMFDSLYAEHPAKWASVRRRSVGPRLSICESENALHRFYRWNFVNMSSLLVRRDLLYRVGLFDTTLKGWEDREITVRLFAAASGGVVDEPLVRRRWHSDQMTVDKFRLKMDAAAATMRILERPWLYPKSAIRFYRHEPARWLREAGEFLLSKGRYAEAKAPLLRSLRMRFSVRTARRYLKALALSRSLSKSRAKTETQA